MLITIVSVVEILVGIIIGKKSIGDRSTDLFFFVEREDVPFLPGCQIRRFLAGIPLSPSVIPTGLWRVST